MVLVVARSKLVLDFALTMHFLHLLVVYCYSGRVPLNTAWWVAMGLSTGSATVLGMWACQWRELRPMSFGGRTNGDGSTGANGDAAATAAGDNSAPEPGILASEHGNENGGDGDLEQGYSRGRGRGRGRDGGGEYEMVRISGERRQD